MDKLSVKDAVAIVEQYKPRKVELTKFDESRKNDYIYCIEWGINKARYNEQAIFDKLLEELNKLKTPNKSAV